MSDTFVRGLRISVPMVFMPCLCYFVSVFHCFSVAPCAPYNVETFAQCEDNLAAVSWAASDGADIYTAIAVGKDGHTHVCVTNTTNCIWEDLHCSEIYTVHVIANSHACSSEPSNSTTIRMGE